MVAVLVGIVVIYNLFFAKVSIDDTSYVCIDRDDNGDSAIDKLKSTGADFSEAGFAMLANICKYNKNVHAGRYEVNREMSTLQLFRCMKNHISVPVKIVLPTTRTVSTLAGKLSQLLLADSVEIMDYFDNDSVLDAIGYTRETLPSLFIPNTYEVYWETTIEDFVNRMVREHDAFWNDERKAQAEKIGMTPVEVATLASIVDSETANNGEKARIAGLYMNRLQKGLPLQSDPTVIFAVGDFSIRRVLLQHLRIESPYNTYRVKGLPPGPIRIASIAGIDAVLNYEHNNYLYMCAKEDFSGTHNFASNIDEHYANARRYTQVLNARGITK